MPVFDKDDYVILPAVAANYITNYRREFGEVTTTNNLTDCVVFPIELLTEMATNFGSNGATHFKVNIGVKPVDMGSGGVDKLTIFFSGAEKNTNDLFVDVKVEGILLYDRGEQCPPACSS